MPGNLVLEGFRWIKLYSVRQVAPAQHLKAELKWQRFLRCKQEKQMHSWSLKENDGNPAEHSGKAMKQKQHVYFLPPTRVENPLTQQCWVSVKGPSAIFHLVWLHW